MTYSIGLKPLDFDTLTHLINNPVTLELSAPAAQRVKECRLYLDNKVADMKHPVYGINTGFGSLYNKSIDALQLEQLQANLVMSHACGTGKEVPNEIVKLMLLLKIQGLSYGNSGVQLETIERLIYFFNNNILPVVFEQGSLGASGDLAPLAHLCLPLLGLGEVYYNETKQSTDSVYKQLNLEPIHLKSKEGLALLNGTQFMSAHLCWCIMESYKISEKADQVAAMSLEAYDGRIEPFHPNIQSIRPHPGQTETANRINALLSGSSIISQQKKHVQDPYSFRCIPQVHGASKDAIRYVASVVLTEINSVTDNPTVFAEEDLIISAGNFHGQPLALAADFLAIALSELGSISERRTYLLISGQRDLPPFLVADAGLNSGFMIPQYTAAALASQNKQLCTPASVDSIVSSNGQEDHVSMGANASVKCCRIIENVKTIIAIELLNAAQALEFRRPLQSSQQIETMHTQFRNLVKFNSSDRILSYDIEKANKFLFESI